MLRKILLSTALVAAAGSAAAADLPYRTAAPAPYVAAAPIFTWTGFYVGLNAGAGWDGNRSLSSDRFRRAEPRHLSAMATAMMSASRAAPRLGYNMQFGSFVAGLEADINYLDRNGGGNGRLPGDCSRRPGVLHRLRGRRRQPRQLVRHGSRPPRLRFRPRAHLRHRRSRLRRAQRQRFGHVQRDYDSAWLFPRRSLTNSARARAAMVRTSAGRSVAAWNTPSRTPCR